MYYKCIVLHRHSAERTHNRPSSLPLYITLCWGLLCANLWQSCCGGEFAFMRVCLRPLRWAVQLNSLPKYQFSAEEPSFSIIRMASIIYITDLLPALNHTAFAYTQSPHFSALKNGFQCWEPRARLDLFFEAASFDWNGRISNIK